MLPVYSCQAPKRRHLKACAHRHEGRKYRRCNCPIWVDGFLKGQEIREPLELRDWERAQEKIRKLDTEGRYPLSDEPHQPITLAKACTDFMTYAKSRAL